MGGIPLFDLMLLAAGRPDPGDGPVILTTQARRRRLDRRIAGLHDAENRGVPAVAGDADSRSGSRWASRTAAGPLLRKAVAVCFGYHRHRAEATRTVVLPASGRRAGRRPGGSAG